jgi:hypothetical protein
LTTRGITAFQSEFLEESVASVFRVEVFSVVSGHQRFGDGGDTFLQTFSNHQQDYMMSQSRGQKSCQNLVWI